MSKLSRYSLALSWLLGASALAGISTPVAAANAPELTVRYGDLDLGRPADLAVLYGRLQRAADAVCIPVPSYELARSAAHQRCVQGVLEHSVRQIHSPALLALHHASTGWQGQHSITKRAQTRQTG